GRIVGGGIPLAAVTSTRAGADRPARDAALHGGESDGGFDPFALAAGAATLSVLSEHREAVYAELFAAGRRLRDDLNAVMAARGPHPPASAAGPVVSVHAAVSAWLGPSAGTEQARKAALHLKTLAHRRGVVIGPGDLAHLSTAHTAQDLAEIAPKLGAAIEELHGVLTGAR
ncbi:MAG: hypothetical protein SFV21_14740, partial [Rhodospirillaceae bacterium]|nr:hypothetical protein [Rhodospirillaceae bacterium]